MDPRAYDVFAFGSSVTLLSSNQGDLDVCIARLPAPSSDTVGRHLPRAPSDDDNTDALFKRTLKSLRAARSM